MGKFFVATLHYPIGRYGTVSVVAGTQYPVPTCRYITLDANESGSTRTKVDSGSERRTVPQDTVPYIIRKVIE